MAYKANGMTVSVKTQFEGIHCYPGAPEEVSFLRVPHRHVFHVEVEMDVFGDDREVEFIVLKHKLNKWLDTHKDYSGVWNMGTLSCEQVAKQIAEYVGNVIEVTKTRDIIVTVSEDGENGAVVYGTLVEEEK